MADDDVELGETPRYGALCSIVACGPPEEDRKLRLGSLDDRRDVDGEQEAAAERGEPDDIGTAGQQCRLPHVRRASRRTQARPVFDRSRLGSTISHARDRACSTTAGERQEARGADARSSSASEPSYQA